MTDSERRGRVVEVLGEVSKAFTFPEVGGARMSGRVAMFHLVHLRDLFTAVGVLLARSQGHGAFVLGRSMFETSLMLGAMENPAKRDAVALRWFHDSNKLNRRLVKLRSTPALRESGEAAVRENDRKFEAARRELGVKKLAPEFVPEHEAKRQGRDEDLVNYLTAHAFTHGNYFALQLRVEHHPDDERSRFFLTAERHPDVLEAAANFACRSALLGLASGCRIFEQPASESLPYLLKLVEFDSAVEGVGEPTEPSPL